MELLLRLSHQSLLLGQQGLELSLELVPKLLSVPGPHLRQRRRREPRLLAVEPLNIDGDPDPFPRGSPAVGVELEWLYLGDAFCLAKSQAPPEVARSFIFGQGLGDYDLIQLWVIQ